jgi:YHS domain-containing protein
MQRKSLMLSAVAALMLLAGAAQAKHLVNVDRNGIGIQGYDPVAYFTDHSAVRGDAKFVSEYNGVKYQFASAEHKALFAKAPATYEPLFGGFCAYGASQNHKAPAQPQAWSIVEGRLVLNYDLDIRETFSKDTKGYLGKANQNWPGLVEKHGK